MMHTLIKLIVVLAVLLPTAILTGCETDRHKTEISDAVETYLEKSLAENQEYGFVGIYNPHDTIFMGEARPYAGVIYTITDTSTGESQRLCADVILSDDRKTVVSFNATDFDPFEFVEEKVTDGFRQAVKEIKNGEKRKEWK